MAGGRSEGYDEPSRCHTVFSVNFPRITHSAGFLPRCGALLVSWAAILSATADAVEIRAGLWATDGPVHALALDRAARILYVGGDFTQVSPADPLIDTVVTRRNLAAFDLSTGEVTAWDPAPDGPVYAMWLNPAGSALYLGGDFAAVGGQFRERLAAVDTTLGLPDTWNPGADGPVRAITPSPVGTSLYIGGGFSRIGGAERRAIAELGLLGTGNLSGLGQRPLFEPGALINALTVVNNRLYVGGRFVPVVEDGDSEDEEASVGERLAAIELSTFRFSDWAPPIDDGAVLALRSIAERGVIYAGGDFSSIGGVPQIGAAAFDLDSGAPLVWNPRIDGPVHALAVGFDRGAIYLGGDFDTVAGTGRSRLAAVDTIEGTPLVAWVVAADAAAYVLLGAWDAPAAPAEEPDDGEDEEDDQGPGDEGVEDDRDILYAGGAFAVIDGVPRGGLVALEALPPEDDPPLTRAEPPGGFISSRDEGLVRLVCDDGAGSGCAATYYTLDGSEPNTDSNRYTGPINLSADVELRFFSVDLVGNVENAGVERYIVEIDPPTTVADPPSGVFDGSLQVRLSCADQRPGCVETRYTTDGTLPTASSPLYTGPIRIDRTTVLQFFSVDGAGNPEGVRRAEYVRIRGEAGALGFGELLIVSVLALLGWRRLSSGEAR